GLTVLLVTAVPLTTLDQVRKTWVQTSGCRLWRNPVSGAEKVWWRELRLEAVAAGSVLRLKSGNMKTGIRAGPDQAAQTAATIRPAHHARWRCRCRAEAALRRRP